MKMLPKLKRLQSDRDSSEYARLNSRDNGESSTTPHVSYGSFIPYLGFIRNTFLFTNHQVKEQNEGASRFNLCKLI